jgi:hypothetical protein
MGKGNVGIAERRNSLKVVSFVASFVYKNSNNFSQGFIL